MKVKSSMKKLFLALMFTLITKHFRLIFSDFAFHPFIGKFTGAPGIAEIELSGAAKLDHYIEKQLTKMFWMPLPAGYSFDYINADVIMNRLQVRDGKYLLPDGMSYSLLVLPELETMRPELLAKIKALVNPGPAHIEIVAVPSDTSHWMGLKNQDLLMVGHPMISEDVHSNVLKLQIVRREFPAQKTAAALFGMQWEAWFTRGAKGWATAHAVSLIGFYDSYNRDALRQHILWFMDIGVNFILPDWSNHIWGCTRCRPWESVINLEYALENDLACQKFRRYIHELLVKCPKMSLRAKRSNLDVG